LFDVVKSSHHRTDEGASEGSWTSPRLSLEPRTRPASEARSISSEVNVAPEARRYTLIHHEWCGPGQLWAVVD
jgi:hypothetical protein